MSHLKAIHAKRRQVHSLKEDEAWRDFVEKHTGQRSTRNLTPKQSVALLAALDDMGGGKSPRKHTLSGPYAKKIQALWIACWNLGLIDTRDDKALNQFAVKQASVSHANWIRDHEDAVAVIEALKKMLERRGVKWSNGPLDPDYSRQPGFKIAAAQWQYAGGSTRFSSQTFLEFVRSVTGAATLADVTRTGWIDVMNALGEVIQVLQSEGVS